MKTGKRSYPLDQLSVSEDGVSVSIHTHGHLIHMSVDDGRVCRSHMIPFREFTSILMVHLNKHGQRSKSMIERYSSTGVEEVK